MYHYLLLADSCVLHVDLHVGSVDQASCIDVDRKGNKFTVHSDAHVMIFLSEALSIFVS